MIKNQHNQSTQNDLMRTEHFSLSWRKGEQGGKPRIELGFNGKIESLSDDFFVAVGFSPQGLEKALRKPADADGTFAFCRKDSTGHLFVGTDRYGISPMYYAGGSDWFIAGTSLNLVKSHMSQVRFDIIALRQLIDLGEILGKRTAVEGISRLRQGEHIVADQTSWKVETWWQIELQDPLPDEVYRDVTEKLLRESLERIGLVAKNSLVCPLTGGDDSRRIAFACKKIGLKPSSYTQLVMRSDGNDVDAGIGQEIASTLGFDHQIVNPPSPQEFVSHTAKVMALTNGESLQHNWAFSLAQTIPNNAIILDGLAAGVLCNGHFVRKYKEYVHCWNDVQKITDLLACNINHVSTRRAIEDELNRLPEHEARLNLFFLFNHTRRNIGCWQQVFRAFGQASVAPFFNGDLFIQALRFSLKDALELSPHFQAMQHFYPQALKIPSTRRGVPKSLRFDLNPFQSGFYRNFALTIKPHPLACELMGVGFPLTQVIRFSKAIGINLGWWRVYKVLILSLLIETIEDRFRTNSLQMDK